MATQQKLSHQLSGEPSLVHRLAANTQDSSRPGGGERGLRGSVDQAQDSLMHSPPHRANLLNAGYNVAGFSVVRRRFAALCDPGFRTQLCPAVPTEAEVLVGRSVDRIRAQSRLPGLQRMDSRKPRPQPAPWPKLIRCALRRPPPGGFTLHNFRSRKCFPRTHPA